MLSRTKRLAGEGQSDSLSNPVLNSKANREAHELKTSDRMASIAVGEIPNRNHENDLLVRFGIFYFRFTRRRAFEQRKLQDPSILWTRRPCFRTSFRMQMLQVSFSWFVTSHYIGFNSFTLHSFAASIVDGRGAFSTSSKEARLLQRDRQDLLHVIGDKGDT
jgi:hypothetical protein